MQYRIDKYGNKISILGYGCMRFTKTAGAIDIDKAEKSARILMEIDDSAKITGYYRITMKVFQKDRKVNIINNETKTPFYLTITLMEVDGTPYIYSWMTRQ